MISLRRRTALSLTALFAAVAVVAGIAAYVSALRERGSLLDLQQRQIARYVGELTASGEASFPPHDTDDDYVVEVGYGDGRPFRTSDPSVVMPAQAKTGFSEFDDAVGRWRVFSLVTPERTVQVARHMVVRREIAASAALRAMLPFVIAILLSWFVLAFAFKRMSRRLKVLAQAMSRNGQPGYDPIDLDGIPKEILPFVQSINAPLLQLRSVIETQKAFLSDAAHELKTPLSALTLQIGNLARLDGSDLDARLAELQAGARRVSALTDQLLKLARYESGTGNASTQTSDLAEIAKEVVAAFGVLAEARGVDLGFAGIEKATIMAPDSDIRTLVESLVDNAVRYTSAGGTVDVTVTADPRPTISVADTGGGVPDAVLPRLTERFFRVGEGGEEGTGLGLAIALAICQRHGLRLSLANRKDVAGFSATITASR